MITRCYLEITNICNLDCLFCPKTRREKRTMSLEEFNILTNRLQGKIEFLYFHLMGEPLLHPHLPQFIAEARTKGFIPVITTNGTLLSRAQSVIEAMPHKIQISLHAHEGNRRGDVDDYINNVIQFAKKAAENGIIIVLRLWNGGGYNKNNNRLIEILSQHIPRPWKERYDGWRLSNNIYLEFDNMFEWPDEQRNEYSTDEQFCYALRNQIGVLADGSVVPCCLDHDGCMTLGNLFEQSLDEILASTRARRLYDGFTRHTAVEPLCRRCGYASVTKRFRK